MKHEWLHHETTQQSVRGQIAANNTSPNSQDDDRKIPALGTSTSASARTPCQDGDRILLTNARASNAAGADIGPSIVLKRQSGTTVVKNPLREGSE